MTIMVISTLRDRTPVPQEKPLEEAQVIWGAPANFSWGSTSQNFASGPFPRGGGVTWPPDKEPDPETLPPITHVWTEVGRKESTRRIDGPDGAYVDFAIIDEVTFRLPDQADGRKVYVVQQFDNQGGGAGAPAAPSPAITPRFIKVPKTTF